ncbi:MAG: hypothetical protein V5A20_02890 [Salinibacter sp.]|uniref:hypothetical protein n=1 Tax=Salinibacter sp. TaxID=2065818 RepID=UPI002FC340F9
MGLHAAARMLTHYVALQASSRKAFVVVELGGLGGRMGLVFVVMILVLLYAPVHVPTYVGTLVCLLIASLVFEVWMIVRRMERDGLAA